MESAMACGVCSGRGQIQGDVRCATCSGSGQSVSSTCTSCGGRGVQTGWVTCQWCGGSGGIDATYTTGGNDYQPRQHANMSFGRKLFWIAFQICFVLLGMAGALDLLQTGSLWNTIRGVRALAASALWVLVPLLVLYIVYRVMRTRR